MSLQNYLKDAWNVFDFVTVLGSITDILVTEINVSEQSISRRKIGQRGTDGRKMRFLGVINSSAVCFNLHVTVLKCS